MASVKSSFNLPVITSLLVLYVTAVASRSSASSLKDLLESSLHGRPLVLVVDATSRSHLHQPNRLDDDDSNNDNLADQLTRLISQSNTKSARHHPHQRSKHNKLDLQMSNGHLDLDSSEENSLNARLEKKLSSRLESQLNNLLQSSSSNRHNNRHKKAYSKLQNRLNNRDSNRGVKLHNNHLSSNRDDSDQEILQQLINRVLHNNNRHHNRNQHRVKSSNKIVSSNLGDPFVKNLLRMSNTLRCGARDSCVQKCEVKKQSNECEEKCEEKFDCEDLEPDICNDSECSDETQKSTLGVKLETESTPCPSC